MKGMILAAGLGTRLRPLTNERPKALVELGGRTLLEIALERLRNVGINEVVINVHAFADLIVEYLRVNRNFGMSMTISREEILLDTGGGVKRAAAFLSDSEEPFLLHNVDVISNFDLPAMIELHRRRQALATLAIQNRPTSRALLFEQDMRLAGHLSNDQARANANTGTAARPFAFAGIHVISPRIFAKFPPQDVFSIITAYLSLASAGEIIAGFRQDDVHWRDLGTPQSLALAEADLVPPESTTGNVTG